MYFHCFLYNMWLSPKDFHTFYKTSHVRIGMIALIFSKLILLPRGLHTFRKLHFLCITMLVDRFKTIKWFPEDFHTFSKRHRLCITMTVVHSYKTHIISSGSAHIFEVASFVHQHVPRNVPKCPSASFLGSFLGWALEWFLSGSCCVPGRPSFQDEVSSRHRAG